MSKKEKKEEVTMEAEELLEPQVVEEETTPEQKSIEEELTEKLAACEDKYLRLYAEYDNFRKRTIKEKESLYTSSVSDTVTAFLPVIDSLDRAVTTDGDPEAIKKGLEMVYKQAYDSLSAMRVEEIDTANGFDPTLHNAVMHIEDESLPPQTIVETYQKGYKIGDKVIRHAMVKVAN